MMKPICFSCHEELRYISCRRMMCFNKTCEKIYAEDYKCLPCSSQKQRAVLMEVVAPGEVCCLLCGNKREAPGLNLETMMRGETISRLGRQAQAQQTQGSTGSSHFRTFSHFGKGTIPEAEPFEKKRSPRPTSQNHVLSTFLERAEPYVEETDRELTIIIEFPGHTLEQIQWHKKDTKLIIESTIITCPYRDEIVLPKWATAPVETNLSNGFFTIRFAK